MKLASLGQETEEHRGILTALGFGELVTNLSARFGDIFDHFAFRLTDEGRAFDDAANVYSNTAEGIALLREAYLVMPAVQALMQGLHGRGAIPVDGALHMLARHKLFDATKGAAFGSLLWTLNELRVVAYSKKFKTD